MTEAGEVTRLLKQWSDGDATALDSLTPLVYNELRKIAGQVFSREFGPHTLQPTALVHEVYAKLIGINSDWDSRAHFYALAARMMRRLLVNHAHGRKAAKRGGNVLKVTFDESRAADDDSEEDVLELDAALAALHECDPRKADVLELHYFGGLTHSELAATLGISESTAVRDLRVGRVWLHKFINDARGNG
jgi:RNA polymerase sigma factor (TIGR02999 family)